MQRHQGVGPGGWRRAQGVVALLVHLQPEHVPAFGHCKHSCLVAGLGGLAQATGPGAVHPVSLALSPCHPPAGGLRLTPAESVLPGLTLQQVRVRSVATSRWERHQLTCQSVPASITQCCGACHQRGELTSAVVCPQQDLGV